MAHKPSITARFVTIKQIMHNVLLVSLVAIKQIVHNMVLRHPPTIPFVYFHAMYTDLTCYYSIGDKC